MAILLSLLLWILVIAVLCWIVSLVPLPAQVTWLRQCLYLLVAIIALAGLLDASGLWPLGVIHRHR